MKGYGIMHLPIPTAQVVCVGNKHNVGQQIPFSNKARYIWK